MIFVPYSDEVEVINQIHKVRNTEYALLRLTFTMIDKNNLDANGMFRELLMNSGLVDYENMGHGRENGVSEQVLFVQENRAEEIGLNFYRVANRRGDRRFSIETIKRRMRNKEVNEGDLLYISYFENHVDEPKMFLINLTNNTPDVKRLIQVLGVDPTNELYMEIQPKLKEVVNGGPYPNLKGAGSLDPKDIGDTLEHLLGVQTNNSPGADLKGLIELKSKRGKTLDTLFTLRPHFEGTPIEIYEPNDRKRVSAFARLYGYLSSAHPEHKSLYVTIGSIEAPQNKQGLYLEVDDDEKVVNLRKIDKVIELDVVVAYWTFDDLKKQLDEKHPATLWIKADSHEVNGMCYFKYHNEFEFSRKPLFATFLSLIKSGIITYDWRGYTTIEGKYSGKNHGNAWRIKPNYKNELFGDIEIVRL